MVRTSVEVDEFQYVLQVATSSGVLYLLEFKYSTQILGAFRQKSPKRTRNRQASRGNRAVSLAADCRRRCVSCTSDVSE